MVMEIGEYYPKPETIVEQGRHRRQVQAALPEAMQRPAERGVLRRLSQSLFGHSEESSEEKTEKGYGRLKRLAAYEEALAKMEDLQALRQSQLSEISSKYAKNQKRGEELRGELSFAKHTGNDFMRARLEGNLEGIRTDQLQLDFDYMNVLRSMFDEALSGRYL